METFAKGVVWVVALLLLGTSDFGRALIGAGIIYLLYDDYANNKENK